MSMTRTSPGIPGIVDRLSELARSCSEQIAMVDDSGSVTWGELDRRVRIARTSLRADEEGTSGPVVLAVTPSVCAVVAYISLMCAGVTVVPADPRAPVALLSELARRSGAAAVVHDDDAVPSWPSSAPDSVSLTDLLAGDARVSVAQAQDLAPALIIFTSGTTGSPSGILCSRGQVAFAANSIQQRLRYRSDDIIASRLPFSFDYGLYQLLMAMRLGATLVLEKSFAFPQAIFERIHALLQCAVARFFHHAFTA